MKSDVAPRRGAPTAAHLAFREPWGSTPALELGYQIGSQLSAARSELFSATDEVIWQAILWERD